MLEKLKELYQKYSPISIFLYGYYATNSATEKSDYEIGVIFCEDNYVSRKELAEFVNNKQISVFPFKHNDLISYSIDTPF